MKKEYATPYLIVESFQLDTAIASCSGDGGFSIGATLDDCMLDFYFASYCVENGGTNAVNPNDENDKICYQGPSGDTVFISS